MVSRAPAILNGRYRVEDVVATGGMGTVYRATDERLQRRVAVKILRADLAAEDRFIERFRREARSVAALSHPNVATVYDYGEDDGAHFIVMELVDGRDLARVLREDGPLDVESSVRIAEQVCDALAHAHAAGVVHRDVKPANVIVGPDAVKVTDFGIARAAGDSRLTSTGAVLGSAHYISPEQADGSPATAASDVYSLGIVIYEMLTGAVPFTGDSPVGVALRHVTGEVPPPSRLNPAVPEALDAVVTRATARDPRDRFPDAATMGAALRAAASPPKASAEPDSTQTVWPIPGDRWDPNRVGRAVALVFGLLLAVALALLVARVVTHDSPARSTRPGSRGGAGPTAAPAARPTVPDVVGETYDDARAALEGAGFHVERNDVPFEDVEHDVVVAARPPVGSAVDRGTTITLDVATGEDAGDKPEPPGHGGDEPPGHEKHDHGEGHGHD